MTRTQALESVSRMAAALPADHAGVERLLERISQQDDAELLRAALMEFGAAVILDRQGGSEYHRLDPSCRKMFTS